MDKLLHPALLLALLASPLPALSQAAASRPAAAQPPAEALAICERAARQSLSAGAGANATDLKFNAGPLDPGVPAGEPQMVLRGSASWRSNGAARRFDYICNVDLRSPETVGLVIRDTTPPPPEPAAPRALVEPDLTNLSPTACESSAAAALKKRWPRVSEISFDATTRTLSQESATRADLQGQGRALPAPGSPQTHFSFDCQLDPRDGRVVGLRIGG